MELYNVVFNENSIEDVFDIVSHHKACVKEDVFKKYFQNIYKNVMEFNFPSEFTFSQKIFHFLRNDSELCLGICKVCGKRTKFLGFSKGYRPYCSSKCMGKDDEFWDKHKQTNLKKYGYENPAQSKEIKNKIKNTNLEKYGCSSSFASNVVKEKIRNTNLERYGCEHYNNPQKIKQSLLNKTKEEWDTIVDKRHKTNLNIYGVENVLQSKEIKDKIRNTNLEKYGVEWSTQRSDVKEKVSSTKMNYTNERNNEINEKRKTTCLEKYGVEYVSQNDDVKKTIIQSKRIKTLEKNSGVKQIDNCDDFVCFCTDENCNMCQNREFRIRRQLYRIRKQNNEELCVIKNPINYSVSNEEVEFKKFIESIYDGEIIFNDRNALNGKEMDVYIPDLKIGFEFNGLYFHSEYFKEKNYHKNKSLLAKSLDITLIQVWEDTWFSKNEIIKDIIKSKFGIFDTKIGARNCKIKEIKSDLARKFINENHLQGYVDSSVKIGLFYNDELVEVATFGKLRKIMNSKNDKNEFELYRFCSKKGVCVYGGFKKILKYFINEYKPQRIITYSSLDISTGNVYEKCGFTFVKNTEPGYYWVNGSKENNEMFNYRKHRFNFRKSELIKQGFSEKMSESEIMYKRGYYKCYDSGNILFEMKR